MLRFFRQLRQRLLTENKFSRYFLYGIGEIVLVVIGILIALQVNTWNEERINNKREVFALKQVTRGVLANRFGSKGLEDEVRYQLALIDSLLLYPELLEPKRIPGMLQVLDEFAPRQNRDDAWYLTYLNLDPTDPIQFQIASYLRSFSSNQEYFDQGKEELGLLNVMKRHLRKAHIPRRILGQGQAYRAFIESPPEGLYSEEDLQAAIDLIHSDSFLADLKTLKEYRFDILVHIEVMQRTNEQFYQYLKSNFKQLERVFEPIQLVGSATPSQSWAVGFPMQPQEPEWNRWILEIELRDGLAKFRAGNSWIFDWGRGEFDPSRLVFKGADIPIEAGNYRVEINIAEGTYDFKPLAK